MDWQTAVLAPLIVTVLTFCGSALCVNVNNYMCKLHENLGLLRNALNELLTRKENVLARVRAGEHNGGTRLDIVDRWLSQVDTIETNTKQLIVEACGEDTSSQDALPVHQRESTSCCWSTDNISNYCLGEKVFKMLDDVRNLYPRGDFALVTQQQASIPVVETTGEGNSQYSNQRGQPGAIQIPQPEVNRQGAMFSVRQLKISGSYSAKYWTFESISESPNGAAIEVAKMKGCYYLEVCGKFNTKGLIFGKRYEVVFVVKVEETMTRWNNPATAQLMVPDNGLQERKFQFVDLVRNEWINIQAGVFYAQPHKEKIAFYLIQHQSNILMTGLLVKGAIIRPMD